MLAAQFYSVGGGAAVFADYGEEGGAVAALEVF